MDLERERGITIKASAVALRYQRPDGQVYVLNLIDTPGHVDFSYEVSRSLTACEGAVLVVDAAQGVEAQTVANAYLALEEGLEIIPVLNKIDLPTARSDDVLEELEQTFGFDFDSVLSVSAKSGTGVAQLLERVVEQVPAPEGCPDAPLRALIFDSVYDQYRGVVVYLRIYDGEVKQGQKIRMMGTGRTYQVDEVGTFRPAMTPSGSLTAGEVGYLIANIKTIQDIAVGDTVTHERTAESVEPLSGYQQPKPMVFCGFYPAQSQDYEELRKALDRLRLNDSAFSFHPESSEALGLGFRCGFLGVLHMAIVQERLERESGIELVQTAPNVTYEIAVRDGSVIEIDTPSQLPGPTRVAEIREPISRVSLILPSEAIGSIMKIAEQRRGTYVRTEYLSQTRVQLIYDFPLAEIIFNFYDQLKSATRGFGTMDYELLGHRAEDLVRLRILVDGEEVDALSMIVHRSQAERRGRALLERLKDEIPRHHFQIPLQAAIGGKVIARENIRALRKDVLAKCYGGDVSRKRKLLDKQREGKRRMKSIGNVEIPQEAFLAVLKVQGDN